MFEARTAGADTSAKVTPTIASVATARVLLSCRRNRNGRVVTKRFLLGLVLLAPALAAGREDDWSRFDVPAGWTVEGERGEYWLASEKDDVASLLLLAADDGLPLEARLASIDEQFLSTGILQPERFETRVEDGEEIVYRSYRLGLPGPGEDDVMIHQFLFWRADVLVLLQVETEPGGGAQEDLFSRVFETLEVRASPAPFTVEDPVENRTSVR